MLPTDAAAPARAQSAPARWLADAIAALRLDLVLYARTAVAMSLRPMRFAAAWREGHFRALNPLAFLGTALAVSSPAILAVSHFAGRDGGAEVDSLWDAFLADQIAPYLQFTLLGLMAHGLLRLSGARQPLLLTIAIALYAGGGPAMFIDVLTLPLDLLLANVAASSDTTANVLLTAVSIASIAAANLAFFVSFARGLAGLHALPLWRPVLALVGAYLVLAGLRIVFFKLVV